jgi:outer membrane protein
MNFKPLFLAILALSATTAFAQKAGTWSASLGVTQISPDVDSGNLTAPSLPGTKVDVSDNTQLTGAVNYSLSDNIVIHLPLGLGFKHNVVGAGAIAGVGTIGTTKALPITLIGQYRFMEANAQLRPYVGGGLSYVKFYKTHGTAVPAGQPPRYRLNQNSRPPSSWARATTSTTSGISMPATPKLS